MAYLLRSFPSDSTFYHCGLRACPLMVVVAQVGSEKAGISRHPVLSITAVWGGKESCILCLKKY
jgi:hypothetical protein